MLSPRTFTSHTPSFLPLPYSSSFFPTLFRSFSSKFSPFDEIPKNSDMGTDKSSQSVVSAIRNDPVMPLADTFQGSEEYITVGSIPVPLHGRNTKNRLLPFSTRCKPSGDEQPELMSRSDHLHSTPDTTVSGRKNFRRRTRIDLGSAQSGGNNCGDSSIGSSFENSNLSLNETLPATRFTSRHDDSLRHGHYWKQKATSAYRPLNRNNNLNSAEASSKLDSSISLPKFKPFDICSHRKRNSALFGDALLEKNKESCFELQEEAEKDMILMPGMVLLKHYLSHDEQVDIVKKCRELGLGPGGFYRPGYADGAKLRLQIMCLGMDWDPQTSKYRNERRVDGSKPPSIPHNFGKLVERAIQEAHCLIKKECGVSYVEGILPSMSPDICIVNFYNTTGRLGLHQDRDESRDSLRRGLPVVSFSIGDSAEFLYGEQRDVERAESVFLESGDVLIFGGESRHVFHGVSSIITNSAPMELLKDTRLSPGRLNLTFRQY